MMAVANEMPGTFSGFWYGEAGEVVVGLTDVTALDAAVPLIEPWLSDFHNGGFIAQQMDHPFALLAAYRTLLREQVFEIDGVVALGVRESDNLVQIQITEPAAEVPVRALLEQMSIPGELVETPVVSAPIEHVSFRPSASLVGLDLRDGEPDGEIQAGWQIQNSAAGTCTLGFTALDPSDSYSEVFVTNSHCTTTSPGFDGGTIYQATTSGTAVGEEVDDPASTCGTDCREADVALISADVGMKFETIARVTQRTGCESCLGALTIDTLDPVITVVGQAFHNIENETLDKVGRTTGWTYGNVEDTCTDHEIDGWTRECSDRVDYSSDGGDSGSPVFSLTGGGNAEIRGIHFGYQGWPFSDALMSDLHQIRLDLGDIVAYEPNTSATILGPDEVPTSASCNWDGDAEGRPPFSYEWRRDGTVVATTAAYHTSDTGTTGFQLRLRVIDARADTVVDQLNVSVDPGDPGFVCTW